jgi:hypothetical protein
VIDHRSLRVVSYWLEHAAGADFVVVDGPTSLKDGSYLVPPAESAAKYRAVNEWLRARTDLPIWWAEVYPVPYGTSGRYAPEELARIWEATIYELERSDAAVALLWQPESTQGHVGLWTALTSAAGGQPTSLRAVLAPWLR